MQNLRQGCDRGMQTLRQARDKGQAITRFMYSAIVHPMEQIPWKDIIAISVVAVLCCLLFMSQIRKADYSFEDINCK
jgi:cell division protein FtsW (lipid II flippase)